MVNKQNELEEIKGGMLVMERKSGFQIMKRL